MKKLLTGIMVCLFSVTAFAQTGKLATDTASVSFINNAYIGSKTEIQASKLALEKADNPEVKTFASQLIKDHTKAIANLKKIAQSKGYNQFPEAVKKPDETLTQTDGAEFDSHFVAMMLQDHEQSVALFQDAAKNVQDADVKAFAVRTLPVLNRHLAVVQKLASGMNIATAATQR
ncbi:MAG: DUF4142 domain-containing protein [Mucilaginibacter polytrichastri]|nr:DUF4142 domain-containing protein [Mucilaginibacter polytrichastri]